MKLKTIYVCTKCSNQSSKWLGKCPSCGEWNSFQEDVISTEKQKAVTKAVAVNPKPLSHVMDENVERLHTGIVEWDRVVGGGVVPGSLMLIGGEPGIGKSTLMLQVAKKITDLQQKILYVSGEESVTQVSMRAQRLNSMSDQISLISVVQLESVLATIDDFQPDFVIIDSIQVLASDNLPGSAGSVSQIRYCTEALMHLAKSKNIPILIVGHVTKEGNIAGPRVLEHLVDVVLYAEGDRYQNLRLLRCVKNRFGSTNEVGVFEMTEQGLMAVSNPAEFFLESENDLAAGAGLTVTIEGTRPFLVEVQALTNTTAFGYPKRTAAGFDLNRLQLMIAILGKHADVNLQNQDVFVNVTGGFRLQDPSCDVAVAMAIASSFYGRNLPRDAVFLGELGLTGEIRPAMQLEQRVKEVSQPGFRRVYVPKLKKKLKIKNCEIIECKEISDLIQDFFLQ